MNNPWDHLTTGSQHGIAAAVRRAALGVHSSLSWEALKGHSAAGHRVGTAEVGLNLAGLSGILSHRYKAST